MINYINSSSKLFTHSYQDSLVLSLEVVREALIQILQSILRINIDLVLLDDPPRYSLNKFDIVKAIVHV